MSFFDRQTIAETLLWRRDLPATTSVPDIGDSLAQTDGNTGDNEEMQAREEDDPTEDGESDTDSSSSDRSDFERDAFDQDLDTLIDYSFISIATTNPTVYEMHRLVQMSTQAWLKLNKAFERWASQFMVNLSDAFPAGKFENWAVCRPLLPHAVLALKIELANRVALLKQSYLLYNAGWFASEQGNYALALTFNRAVLMLDRNLLGEEHVNTLKSMNNLALTYRHQGLFKEAEKLHVEVLEAQRRVLGEEHLDTLGSVHNIAITHRDQGRWKEAEELHAKVLEARRRVLGEEHSDTLESMHNLASTYSDQGRWEEAEELHAKVLEARRRVLGEEHVDILESMHNLASTYSDQGRWREAVKLQVKVLEVRSGVLGAEHPETLMTTSDLAWTLRHLGQHDAALDLMEQAASLSAKVLGDEHPDKINRFRWLDEWAEQDLERGTVQGSGLGSKSNEEDDAVAGATGDDEEAPERPEVDDDTSSEQKRIPKANLLDPSAIAHLQSMDIHRISGFSDPTSQTQRIGE
nr:hypothetical protein B0A51_14525 [Rachicladosporium sp. CCFEE 5018]